MSIDTRAMFQLLEGSPDSLREAAVLLAGSPPTNDGGILAACFRFAADQIEAERTLAQVTSQLETASNTFSNGTFDGAWTLTFEATLEGTVEAP